jgi:hypothetical protein
MASQHVAMGETRAAAGTRQTFVSWTTNGMLTSPEFNEARKAYLGLTPGPVQNEVMGILHNSADVIQMRSCVRR